ncbi:Hypothetical protein PHPALM_17061 [Phytophthora palmivora]|uniref:Uncharacterized protein n=1 Tax=Phytophthora palmivora TaxID=4796 RepID=A0A2P4XNB6_9STRA|nr:Hypothetical protein PHPALM_17061 [Phytophthora palmivora]
MSMTPKKSGGDHNIFTLTGERSGDNVVLVSDSVLEVTTDSQGRMPHPIFVIVNPPKVSSMAREPLVGYLKLRKENEEYTKDPYKDGTEDGDAMVESVKRSFDAHGLEYCARFAGVWTRVVSTDSFQNHELPDMKELFREELRMNTTTNNFDARQGIKEKCKLIVNFIPKGLKNKVIEERALQKTSHSSCKHEKEYKPSSNLNKRNNGHHNHRTVKKVKHVQNSKQHQQNGDRPEREGAKGVPKEGCFHCGGPHYLSKCPTSTHAEVMNCSLSTNTTRKGPKGRHHSGADRCCLDESCFERLRKVKPDIVRIKLNEPLQRMMADGTSVRVDWIVQLKLRLQTVAGKPVECLVILGDSAEFLLGSDLLLKLGIDVERQIDLLDVPLAADVNGNELDNDDEPVIGRTVIREEEEDVRTGILEFVELAIKDDFPREFAEELTRIVLSFDLWRICLGMDPLQKFPQCGSA